MMETESQARGRATQDENVRSRRGQIALAGKGRLLGIRARDRHAGRGRRRLRRLDRLGVARGHAADRHG